MMHYILRLEEMRKLEDGDVRKYGSYQPPAHVP